MKLAAKRFWSSAVFALLFGVLFSATPAHAFWVVNFGSAKTLSPGHLAFAAGIGGQAVFVSDFATAPPAFRSNALGIIPHAGLRPGVQVGIMLATTPVRMQAGASGGQHAPAQ